MRKTKFAANGQKGVALVEFALVLPLLLVVTLLVTELGRALYQYNVLTKSVRDAARYLSVQNPSIKTTDPDRVDIARNLAVYGSPLPVQDSLPLALNLSLANVPPDNISWSRQGSNPLINTVTVEITGYAFRPLWGDVFGVQFGNDGSIPFGTISATMRAPL